MKAPKKTQEKICVIYCRVSTDEQRETGLSLESQEASCRGFAAAQGWKILRVVYEDHSAFYLEERQVFQSVREDIRLGRANILLSHAFDRLTRNQDHAGQIFRSIREYGGELWCVEEGAIGIGESTGKFMGNVYAYLAEQEREKIRERTMRGRKQRLLNGKIHNAGVPLYGYRINREEGRREIYEPEAAVVREIFRLCVEEKLGVHGITLRMIMRGIPTPSEGNRRKLRKDNPVWQKSAVYRILRRHDYMGETVGWMRTTCGSKSRTPSLRPENEHVKLPAGVTPPIISKKVWEAAQKQLASNVGTFTRNAKHPALLRGHIYCWYCERKMVPTTDKVRRYRCGSHDAPGEHCANKRLKADEIEQFAWAWIARILKDPDVLTHAIEKLQQEDQNPQWRDDLRIAKETLAKTKANMEALVERMARADELDGDIFEGALAKLKTERAGLERVIGELEQRIASNQKQVADLRDLREYSVRERDRIDNYSFEEKVRAIAQLDVRVVAKPNCWRVDVPVEAYSEATGLDASVIAEKPRICLKPAWADTFADDLVEAGILQPTGDVVSTLSSASKALATTRATSATTNCKPSPRPAA